MINLYIFMAVLIGFLIILSIKFTIYEPSDNDTSSNNNNNNNNNNQPILDYYGEYGDLQSYSDYDDFIYKCEK
jgi:hypothetical protein